MVLTVTTEKSQLSVIFRAACALNRRSAIGRQRLSMPCDSGHVEVPWWIPMGSIGYLPKSRRRASSRLGARMTAMWL